MNTYLYVPKYKKCAFSLPATKPFPTQPLDDNIFVHLGDSKHHNHLLCLHNHGIGEKEEMMQRLRQAETDSITIRTETDKERRKMTPTDQVLGDRKI